MINKFREYEFEEWLSLSNDDQIEIINKYWNPYEPEIGKKTRNEIIYNFKKSLEADLRFCEFRYFGFYASALFVIPKDSETKLGSDFAGLQINKGKILEENGNKCKVKWSLSGLEEMEL
jgi:hypothetical protein